MCSDKTYRLTVVRILKVKVEWCGQTRLDSLLNMKSHVYLKGTKSDLFTGGNVMQWPLILQHILHTWTMHFSETITTTTTTNKQLSVWKSIDRQRTKRKPQKLSKNTFIYEREKKVLSACFYYDWWSINSCLETTYNSYHEYHVKISFKRIRKTTTPRRRYRKRETFKSCLSQMSDNKADLWNIK